MIKIIAIVFCALLLNIILKDYAKEFCVFINIVSAGIVFLMIFNDLKIIIKQVDTLTQSVGVITPYIKIMLKILGISMLAGLLSDLCRDNGENTLANQTELSAKIIILVTALPLFSTIINIMTGILK
ncbi:MAG: SpoIIIAC/SpoIIIAD family protein [Eubacteriales bacterium]|nr:SpoIIIAC/SpoIIIAD family protein [Eubacteriales bacterium]